MERISQLKDEHQRLGKKQEEMETSAFEEMEQEQAEIDAAIDKLRAGLADLDQG